MRWSILVILMLILAACGSGESAPSGTATPEGRWGVFLNISEPPPATPSGNEGSTLFIPTKLYGLSGIWDNVVPAQWLTTAEGSALYRVDMSQDVVEIERCDYAVPGGIATESIYRTSVTLDVTIIDLTNNQTLASNQYVGTPVLSKN